MTDRVKVLVWDAGGSKTDVLVVDTSGWVLAYARGGPANVNFVPRAQVEQSLSAAIRQALDEATTPPKTLALACVAGPTTFEVAERVCRQVGIHAPLRMIAEGEAALWATQPWHTSFIAVSVGAGTGSIVYGRHPDGRTVGVGGWGALVGDEGSAYWIGLRGLNAVTRALDGRDPAGELSAALLAALEVPDTDGAQFIRRVYQPPLQRHEIAALAPVVVQAADAGDRIAQRILTDAGRELGEQANAAIQRLGLQKEAFSILTFGSVFKAGEWVLASFRATIRPCAPQAGFVTVRMPPVIGNAVVALQALGVALTPAILSNLEAGAVRIQR